MRHPRGITLIEVTAAIAVVSILALLVTQLLQSMAVQQRNLERQMAARLWIANLLDRELAAPFAEVEPGESAIEVEAAVERLLPGALAAMNVEEVIAADLPAKRITVMLTWGDANAPSAGQAKLVGWKYPSAQEVSP
jgi:prepilin-type N-terminal cleavage/methylation domain-containing protein